MSEIEFGPRCVPWCITPIRRTNLRGYNDAQESDCIKLVDRDSQINLPSLSSVYLSIPCVYRVLLEVDKVQAALQRLGPSGKDVRGGLGRIDFNDAEMSHGQEKI
jgi:hypothetical protein